MKKTPSFTEQGLWPSILLRYKRRPGNRGGVLCMQVVAVLFLLLLPFSNLPAQEQRFKTLETRYATISYMDERDLDTFTRNTRSGRGFMRSVFGGSARNPLQIKTQVDNIVETVFSLLDMFPPRLQFNITLYRSREDLITAYRATGMMGAVPLAFYSHGNRTIAVHVENITDYILAHEIGHAVISAYFTPPPPVRMQEILCQYIDKHYRTR